MIPKTPGLALVCASVLALVQLGCEVRTSPASGTGNQENERISIVNDPATLGLGVTYYDEEVVIDESGIGYPSPTPTMRSSRSQASAPTFSLWLRAEVAPPTISGQVLQATSVSIVGDRAIVGYNMRGAQYLGAVDVFDVSNKNRPQLLSRALFKNADINAASTYGTAVYAAEATGDTGFQSPAAFEIMQLVGNNLVLDGNRRLELPSYAGTSAAASGTRAYATSGDNGSLFAIEPATLEVTDSINLDDARWVSADGGKIVVVQGTPGRIVVFDETSLAPLGTFPFAGADVPESKSTVELVGGKAFIAAGTAGVQVLSATTGTVLGSVPLPDPAALGLDPSVVVTNAVSADEDLLFISNGEAGVYVAHGSENFSATGSEAQQQLTMIGRLQFGDLESVNHVVVRSKYLIVAAGLGGLKIVEIK